MSSGARWFAAIAAMSAVHVFVYLAVTGVPKPATITAVDVGRVAWAPLVESTLRRVEARGSRSLVGWMPDGSGLMTIAPRFLFDARLHVVRRPGGKVEFLPRIPRNAQIHPAPGRPYVVFGTDRDGDEQYNLFRWDLDEVEPVLLTSGEERAAMGAFEPEGHRIAYVSTRRNGRDFDLYVMDVRDAGSDRLVSEMDGLWRVMAWSPTSESLLLGRATSNLDVQLFLIDLEDGSLRRLQTGGDGPARVASPIWSRDGRSIYYASDRGSEFTHLRKLDLESGREAVLSEGIPWDVESVQESGDGARLLVSVNEDGRTRYYMTDGAGGGFRPLDLFASGQMVAKLHHSDPVILVNHTDARGFVRGFLYDLSSGELERWVGEDVQNSELPAPRLVRYPTFDEVDGAQRMIPAFVYPGVGDGPRPVVIDIHGGPEAQARLRAGQGASQRAGMTVITPNVRGSTGYGRTYTTLDDWWLREDAVRDIGALLDWIADQPDLDEDRVAVIGGSYGGYMVLASLVHYGTRLRCGVDVVGVSNFVTFLQNTAEYRKDLRRAEYGDERIPEMRAFLEEISPLNNAEGISSRLMVVQGANDPRVPVRESRQMVERLRSQGLDVSYIEGANEGHGFREPWNALWAGLSQQGFTRDCLSGQ